MEIHLNPDVEAKLNNIAAARGSEPELLASEAVEHFVNYDEWFLREVERGLASADTGELLSHEEVGARLQKRVADRQSSR